MLARTRLKLKNAESSITFMQEQHARTLEDLHKEIEKLQKKNARLTFEITMAGCKASSGDIKLEEELISELVKLQSSLSKEQENGALLQHQVDNLFTRHSEDIVARDNIISQLNNELEAKANVIALVTQHLYQARTRLKQEIEARSKKNVVCTCPHCFVHRKASQTGPSSSAEGGRLSPLREFSSSSLTDADTDSSTNTTASETTPTGKRPILSPHLSTSPISPHPPSSSAGRSHTIKKRASTPIRRQSPSPNSHTNFLSTDMCSDYSHLTSSQQPLRPARATKDGRVLSSELQQLLSLKEGDAKIARRDTPLILPPISSNVTEEQCFSQATPTSVVVDTNGRYQSCQQLPGASAGVHSSHVHHRRLILAKSKGLSSAPSTLRVLHYGPVPVSVPRARPEAEEAGETGGIEGGAVAGEEGLQEELEGERLSGPEGTLLLVKENDQKGSVGPAQWAAAEGDTWT